jgi:hypothetical protein
MGAQDGYMYAFRDAEPTAKMSLVAYSDKGAVMWNNETLTIQGYLRPQEKLYTDPSGAETNLGIYGSARMANTTVNVIITGPNNNTVTLEATTDNNGHFVATYTPTTLGNYSWFALYNGKQNGGIIYEAAYTGSTDIESVAAPGSETTNPTTEPTPEQTTTPEPTTTTPAATTTAPDATENTGSGIPTTYIYAIVAVIVIVVIAVAAFMVTKRKK